MASSSDGDQPDDGSVTATEALGDGTATASEYDLHDDTDMHAVPTRRSSSCSTASSTTGIDSDVSIDGASVDPAIEDERSPRTGRPTPSKLLAVFAAASSPTKKAVTHADPSVQVLIDQAVERGRSEAMRMMQAERRKERRAQREKHRRRGGAANQKAEKSSGQAAAHVSADDAVGPPQLRQVSLNDAEGALLQCTAGDQHWAGKWRFARRCFEEGDTLLFAAGVRQGLYGARATNHFAERLTRALGPASFAQRVALIAAIKDVIPFGSGAMVVAVIKAGAAKESELSALIHAPTDDKPPNAFDDAYFALVARPKADDVLVLTLAADWPTKSMDGEILEEALVRQYGVEPCDMLVRRHGIVVVVKKSDSANAALSNGRLVLFGVVAKVTEASDDDKQRMDAKRRIAARACPKCGADDHALADCRATGTPPCAYCSEVGHGRAECPRRVGPKPGRGPPKCQNCQGRHGTGAWRCPNRWFHGAVAAIEARRRKDAADMQRRRAAIAKKAKQPARGKPSQGNSRPKAGRTGRKAVTLPPKAVWGAKRGDDPEQKGDDAPPASESRSDGPPAGAQAEADTVQIRVEERAQPLAAPTTSAPLPPGRAQQPSHPSRRVPSAVPEPRRPKQPTKRSRTRAAESDADRPARRPSKEEAERLRAKSILIGVSPRKRKKLTGSASAPKITIDLSELEARTGPAELNISDEQNVQA